LSLAAATKLLTYDQQQYRCRDHVRGGDKHADRQRENLQEESDDHCENEQHDGDDLKSERLPRALRGVVVERWSGGAGHVQ